MSYNTKVNIEQGGDVLNIASGGQLQIAGTDVTTALATAPAAVAAGYKIARGETALDGSNPTPVATGLTTVVSFVPTIKSATALGTALTQLSADISTGGTVNVYAWKVTSAGDSTLIASTSTASFYWIAVGT